MTSGLDGVERIALQDAVATAEGALRHQQAHLRARVEDLQALDGMVIAAWTTLLGTRDQRLEDGMLRIQHAQRTVAAAEVELERARAALDSFEQRRREDQEQAAQRIVVLEDRAATIRGTRHPSAPALADVEARIDRHQAQIATLDEVIAAAGGVLAAASSQSARTLSWRTSGPFTTQAERLATTLAGFGVDWSAQTPGLRRPIDDDDHERTASAKLQVLAELDQLRQELRLVLEPIVAERKAATATLNAARDARDRLLADVS